MANFNYAALLLHALLLFTPLTTKSEIFGRPEEGVHFDKQDRYTARTLGKEIKKQQGAMRIICKVDREDHALVIPGYAFGLLIYKSDSQSYEVHLLPNNPRELKYRSYMSAWSRESLEVGRTRQFTCTLHDLQGRVFRVKHWPKQFKVI